jgi:hypothetical protein
MVLPCRKTYSYVHGSLPTSMLIACLNFFCSVCPLPSPLAVTRTMHFASLMPIRHSPAKLSGHRCRCKEVPVVRLHATSPYWSVFLHLSLVSKPSNPDMEHAAITGHTPTANGFVANASLGRWRRTRAKAATMDKPIQLRLIQRCKHPPIRAPLNAILSIGFGFATENCGSVRFFWLFLFGVARSINDARFYCFLLSK